MQRIDGSSDGTLRAASLTVSASPTPTSTSPTAPTRRRRRLASFLLAAAAILTAGAPSLIADDGLTIEEQARIHGYAALLDSDEETTRREAELELLRIGERARPILDRMRTEAQPEARRRLDAILARLDDARRTAAPAEWPGLRGGPQRSGVTAGTIPRTKPAVTWTAEIPDNAPLQGAIAATADAVVTFSADGTVRCFAAADGTRRWISVLDSPITASAAVAAGRVIVPTGAGIVTLDVRDGRQAWTAPATYGCHAAPAVVGSRVFAALRSEGVVALDLATGERRMERKLAPRGALLADTDLLVTGTDDGTFHSLDPDSGRDRWKVDLGAAPSMGPTLAAPGVVVVLTKDRGLQALRASDGRNAWIVRLAAPSPSESLAAAAGRVFVTDTAGFVHAYDAATGRHLWNRNEGFVEMGAPAASADAVCFGARGRLGCRDAATGDFLWRLDAPRNESSSPVVAAGRVFVLHSGQLRCLK